MKLRHILITVSLCFVVSCLGTQITEATKDNGETKGITTIEKNGPAVTPSGSDDKLVGSEAEEIKTDGSTTHAESSPVKPEAAKTPIETASDTGASEGSVGSFEKD